MTNSDRAVDFVAQGMSVGLGSGRAAERFIHALAARAKSGLHVRCVATSKASGDLAASLGLNVVTLDEVSHLDVAVDGADEVDPYLNLIKGYGLAHVREKIVASAARRFVILIGPEGVREKLVPVIGHRGKLPVEVLPFGLRFCQSKLEEMVIVMPRCSGPTEKWPYPTMATRCWRARLGRPPIPPTWSERSRRFPAWSAPGFSSVWPTR